MTVEAPVFEAVIFDMDGVLVESEHLWEENWVRYSAMHDYAWLASDTAMVQGMSVPEWARYLAGQIGSNDPDHIMEDIVANMIASLHGGRVVLGIGCGWNEEELENHRPDLEFRHRYSAMRERVDALRTAWRDETASYDGRWDRYTESWVYPKPVSVTVPIALGTLGAI